MLVIGWREWVSLPSLIETKIKAKIDTGARTSSLHAFDIVEYKKGKKFYVEFSISPLQKSKKKTKRVTVEVIEYRKIKSSNGIESLRPVIQTELQIGAKKISIELTLTSRDEMGFRMLVGRQALKKNFLIDPCKSFLQN